MVESTEITKVTALGLAAWQITSPSGARAVVAERGATLLSWQPEPGLELIAGYETAAELLAGDGARSMILAPWAGTIADSCYTYAGRDIQVDDSVLSYSLAYLKDFTVYSSVTTLSMAAEIEPSDLYPWRCALKVHFSLDDGANGEHLSMTLEARNLSDTDAPITVGWHPYLRFGNTKTVNNLGLSVPARTRIIVNHQGVPLPGESAQAGVNVPMEIEYLGTHRLNDYYRGLVPDNYGVVATRLTDPTSNSALVLTQEPAEAAVVHVHTGDSLTRAPRSAIALAPLSAVPDSFNRPDAAGAVHTEPGQVRQMTATLTYYS